VKKEIVLTTATAADMLDYGRKSTTLVLENEEIYIMNMVLPAAEKHTTWNMIKDELTMKFGNIDSILFDFDLSGKTGKTIEATVYCINFDMKKIVSELKRKGGILQGVYPLQLYVLKKYQKLIRDSSYLLAFLFRNTIYLAAAANNMLVMNKIIDESEGFNEQNFGYLEGDFRVIYLINIKKEAMEGFLSHDFRIEELKPFNENIF